MNTWIIVAGAGLGSYLLRLSMLVLLRCGEPPEWLDRATSLVMPAAFAAIVVPAIVTTTGLDVAQTLPRAGAVLAGGWVAHRTRSPGLAIAAGMPVLWLGLAVSSTV